jgi:two-component system cell cycle response regulator
MAGFRNDEPVFGREGLFRQKLNQLRTTGHISNVPQVEGQARTRELEASSYLAGVQQTLSESDPKDMERLTLLDSLTQLYNQRTIERALNDEIKRAKRYKSPVTILLLAVDGFGEIAAGHGKLAADSILQGVANFLMRAIRDVDIPGRYDVEHFLIICPQTDASGVGVMAERIRNRVAVERVSDVGQNWTITLSIGVASYPSNAHKEEDLIEQSAKALTSAQNNGGNSVAIA